MDATLIRKQLIDLGFYKHAPTQPVADICDVETLCNEVFGETGRRYFADAEELAEGRVVDFLQDVSPFLAREHAELGQIVNQFSDKEYMLRVNGRKYVIYSAEELKRELTQPGLIWGLAMARSFALINQVLKRAKSAERAFAVNGGNELLALFLTTPQWKLICQIEDLPASHRPYLPTDEYPWHGATHD